MMRHLTTLIAAALLLAAGGLQAREIGSSSPERQGFSSERLQRLSTFMDAKVADGTMVGGMGLIARNGRVVYSQTYGMADREVGRPMTADAIYRIYSMSKPVTSVALMMLYEEGKFSLDDPVAKYIPELANLQIALSTAGTGVVSDGIVTRTTGESNAELVGQTRAPARQPTIHDLLTHTAGFTYGIFGNTEVDQMYRGILMAGDIDLQELVAKLGKLPLQYEPGTQWHYSIANDIQGRLIEVLSGMRFGEFLQQRLFAPLDMQDTAFYVPVDKLPRLTQLYKPKGMDVFNYLSAPPSQGLDVADAWLNAGFVQQPKLEGGGGGLVSTARDYLRFSQMLLNGGELDGVQVLSPKTIQLMTTNQLGDIALGYGRGGIGFGLGVGIVLDSGRAQEISSPGTYSWGGAAGTRFWVDPRESLVGIFMVQSVPHMTSLGDDFRVLTYAAMTESQIAD